ncbi:hypothetical protein GCM10023211_06110 [Orbus sasakiae]|uniref:ATPase dynein-related AAA domain-containing protein n=1 Tax=Orbus sasakiae TaxID=1078475 RepID=A0ABP9N2X7_9GAMM
MINCNDFKLWNEFLAIWPLDKVQSMPIDKYTSIEDKTTFTYWLEHLLRPYGSIRGGSAEKFGIFKKKNMDSNPKSHLASDEHYTWNLKYGKSPQEAFENIRSLIVEIIQCIRSGNISVIENIDLAFTLKWKIAFHYQNITKPILVSIFSEKALQHYFQEKTLMSDVLNKLEYPLTQDNLMAVSYDIYKKWISTKKITIWKLSHGKETISEEVLNQLDKDLFMMIHQDTPKSQAKKFKDEAKIGDFVYLTRSNSVYALVQIISNCEQENNSPWLVRKYKIVKKLPRPIVYDEAFKKGWTPNYNSTFYEVPKVEFSSFESKILDYFFGYSIDELIELSFAEPHQDNDNLINGKLMDNKKQSLNQIFYGPPGTGKTYHTINTALSMIGIDIQGKDRQTLKQIFDEKVEAGQIVFTTFHQSTCYEDFIEGIKPILDDSCEQSQICYQIQEGVFKQLANKAKIGNLSKTLSIDQAIEKFKEICVEQKVTLQTSTSKLFDVKYHGNTTFRCYPQNSINDDLGNGYAASIRNIVEYIVSGESKTTAYNPSYVRAIGEYLKLNYQLDVNKPSKDKKQNFVLIIDEINRGNVSQIFGELITLIEDDKRLGNSEALTVTLPYSKQKFGVPNNLYIIGTMNTADRSVEALDTALRRRFCFTEMRPQPALLNAEQHNSTEVKQFPLNEILSTINKRLEILLDRDHQIGHSYFMNIQHLDELCDVFNNNVIPLLQEYFFNDYAKIGLVLGNGFVEKINIDTHQNNIFAEFDDEHDTAYQYQDKIVYRLNKIAPDTLSKALSSLLHRNIKQ